MGEVSAIEWCDSTFNPWMGCTKISDACDFCYAEALTKRFGQVEWGNHPRTRTSESNWNKPLQWQRGAEKFMALHGRPRFVFCASLADVFDNQVPDEWRADLWDLIRRTPDLVWLLLTKRPQNMHKFMPEDWGEGWPHVWLGTTVEHQEAAERNVPVLLSVPAARRFLSCEPLLGPVDFNKCVPRDEGQERQYFIDWIITGGESGPNARPSHPDWFRDLRDQCEDAGVYFHFKQWGEWRETDGPKTTVENRVMGGGTHWIKHDGTIFDRSSPQRFSIYSDYLISRMGKKKAGRLLDGRTWDERPEPVSGVAS